MTLSNLSLLIGAAYIAGNGFAILQPRRAMEWLRAFPRNHAPGVVLILIATAWFEYNLVHENVSDFAQWKPALIGLFAFGGVGACFYLRDYLSIRGLACVMLLVAHVVLETQRWHPSPLKNILTTWAYVLIIPGMWWVVSPWRARDLILWGTAQEGRFKGICLAQAAFGIVAVLLGLTQLR